MNTQYEPIDPNIAHSYQALPKGSVWINEAMFGYHHLKPYLAKLSSGDKVLEVGAGSGILLSQIKSKFPDLDLTGLEPFGSGFDALSPYQSKLDPNIKMEWIGYETFQTQTKYNFIFLVNVFEHLPDWKHFLDFVKTHLVENGTCVILCPNYGFPYESHFHLPIVLNKTTTHKIFKNYIENFEHKNDLQGLWNSLNFVTWSQVQKACKSSGITCTYKNDVIFEMIDRLDSDEEFKARQKTMGIVAKLLRKTGVLNLLKADAFNLINPYMKIEVRLK